MHLGTNRHQRALCPMYLLQVVSPSLALKMTVAGRAVLEDGTRKEEFDWLLGFFCFVLFFVCLLFFFLSYIRFPQEHGKFPQERGRLIWFKCSKCSRLALSFGPLTCLGETIENGGMRNSGNVAGLTGNPVFKSTQST